MKKYTVLTISYLIGVSLIDFMGLGMVVTLFPKLLLDPSLRMLPSSWGYDARLMLIGVFLAIYPLGQFFGAAILGKLSDHYGRKPLMVMSLLGTIIGFILTALSVTAGSSLWLFVSRLISGVFAGNAAIAQASIVDLSTPQTKARNISILQITLGFAWVIGPPLGGWLSQSSVVSWFNYATPFWILTVLLVVAWLITIFFFQETIKVKQPMQGSLLNQFQGFTQAISHPSLRWGFIVWSTFVAGWWLFEAYLPTFLQQQWLMNPAHIGTYLGCMGLTYAMTQLLVLRRIGQSHPHKLVKHSLYLAGAAVMGLAVVHTLWALIAVTGLYVVSMAFALPGLITSVSNLASEDEQGQVMGLIASLQAIMTVSMMLLGGVLVAQSYAIPILGGGALLILSWLVFCSKVASRRQTQIAMEGV